MDDKNKGMNERWPDARTVPERGYAADEASVDRRTAEIRSDIERTRADMTETIDAIQDRLRPSSLASQAKDTVRDAAVGKVKQMANSARDTFSGGRREWRGGGGIADRIREHPVPAAIAAASIAYIAFGGRRRADTRPAIYGTTAGGDARLFETEISTDVDFDAGYDTRYGADAEWRGERMRRTARQTRNGLQRFVNDNPLAAGAVAAAVGATIGLALPETERENELMGEARDTVVDKAREAARDAADRVQDAAQRVKDTAADAAKNLTRGE